MNIDNNENIIGERIKRFRSYTLNMNQRQFAEALGIQPSTLSGYEKGNIVPSTDVLLKIASTYNISLDWLFGLSNDSIHFSNLGEVISAILQISDLNELRFEVDRNKPDIESGENRWYCALKFYGKDDDHKHNGDLCSFLDSLYEHRSDFESYFESLESYEQWKKSIVDYYSDLPVSQTQHENLDYDARIAKRNALLDSSKKKKK